ncbi:MAG: UBP-type zinc finger domain-containing protein [Actinobacteria bacterium]|nr:MAG: UBP-type zinc finger domain-containing protein [Actinomycetota bacterium]
MAVACSHLDEILDPPPRAEGCEECLAMGGHWLHLRRCMACGHIGCCDSSPNKHASKHARTIAHPIVQSFEPGEDWLWCYVDEVGFEIPELAPSPAHP